MIWAFLSVVLILAVGHPGFRKVLLWGLPAWLLIAFFIA
jgi:hypothetical protein